jgi:outer membrane protein assembly factor BamD
MGMMMWRGSGMGGDGYNPPLSLGIEMQRILAFLFLFILLGGCSLLPDQIDETKSWSASKLYSEAKERIGSGDFAGAVDYFEKLESRYPYGPHAVQAQLEIAYAYYKDNEPASAVAACDRFIKLHPNHPHVDYAYYLKGLANFVEDLSFFALLASQDMSDRDPKSARESFNAFKDLATRFPDSKYTPDAVARMTYLSNALALNEIHVARFYMRKGAYVGAINRAKYLLENYKSSPAQEDALGILAMSYDAMGIHDLRDDAKRVLKQNFPNSVWLSGQAPKKKQPWWQFWAIESKD